MDPKITRALISVSDKLGVADFARGLADVGIEIYSTGGTRRHLENAGIEVHDVSSYTEFPEMMDGRVKTLHPKIFAGILCRHDRDDDMDSLEEHDIATFELVVVNLYPFAATIARAGVTPEQATEQIDIGGPSLVRAAAKNHKFTTVVTNPEQYWQVLEQVHETGSTSAGLRRRLMSEAFLHTADYDRVISEYFHNSDKEEKYHEVVNVSMRKKTDLRYGENPHQSAALYSMSDQSGANLVSARQLNGKELSYNNLLDLDSALNIVKSFGEPAASVIKHNNPCGAATGETLLEAVQKGMDGDPLSAFGSVIGVNRTLDVATAEYLSTPGLFIEAIVAPDFEAAAVGVLTTKPKWRKNVRLMQVGRIETSRIGTGYRFIDGGMLLQDSDTGIDPESEWEIVTDVEPDDETMDELRFGWEIVRHVKSNAITISKDLALLGCGAGQMSRVDSVEISIDKAGDRCDGAILASDAFFPFPDSIDRAAEAGIVAVIQPGGSKKDEEVIAACNEHGIAMVMTGRRHFKH